MSATPEVQHDRRARRILAGVLLVACLAALPPVWQQRSAVARQLRPFESVNTGYADVGHRLSTRFREGTHDDGGTGLLRNNLQRQRMSWDFLLFLLGVGVLVPAIVLGRPLWTWWRGRFHRSLAEWQKQKQKKSS